MMDCVKTLNVGQIDCSIDIEVRLSVKRFDPDLGARQIRHLSTIVAFSSGILNKLDEVVNWFSLDVLPYFFNQ